MAANLPSRTPSSFAESHSHRLLEGKLSFYGDNRSFTVLLVNVLLNGEVRESVSPALSSPVTIALPLFMENWQRLLLPSISQTTAVEIAWANSV